MTWIKILPFLILTATLCLNVAVAYYLKQIDSPFVPMSLAASRPPSRHVFLCGLTLTSILLQLNQFSHTSPRQLLRSLRRVTSFFHTMTLADALEEIKLFWLPYGFLLGMTGLAYWNDMNVPLDRTLHIALTNIAFASTFIWLLLHQPSKALILDFMLYLGALLVKFVLMMVLGSRLSLQVEAALQWLHLAVLLFNIWTLVNYDAEKQSTYYIGLRAKKEM